MNGRARWIIALETMGRTPLTKRRRPQAFYKFSLSLSLLALALSLSVLYGVLAMCAHSWCIVWSLYCQRGRVLNKSSYRWSSFRCDKQIAPARFIVNLFFSSCTLSTYSRCAAHLQQHHSQRCKSCTWISFSDFKCLHQQRGL